MLYDSLYLILTLWRTSFLNLKDCRLNTRLNLKISIIWMKQAFRWAKIKLNMWYITLHKDDLLRQSQRILLGNAKTLTSAYRYKLACRVFSEGQQSVLIHSEGHHYAFCKLTLFTCNTHALSKLQYYLHS